MAKVGRPVSCYCGKCRNCQRRKKYQEAKEAKKQAQTAPTSGSVVGIRSLVDANESPRGEAPEPEAKPDLHGVGVASYVETSPKVEMPDISAPLPQGNWAKLAEEDPDDPNPQEQEAAEEAEKFEERAADPTFVHSALGSAAGGLFSAFVAKIEANGYKVPDVEFQGMTLPRDMIVSSGATMVQESATRVAVKYLPDVAKPALYDEMVVIGMLGGAGAVAGWTSKNPRKLPKPSGEEEITEEETVGTGETTEDFEPAPPPEPVHGGVQLLQVGV